MLIELVCTALLFAFTSLSGIRAFLLKKVYKREQASLEARQ